MELERDVDYAMASWARWMRNNDNVSGYPSCDVSYRLTQAGYSSDKGSGHQPMPEMPDHVAAADGVVRRMPAELRDFVKAWWGVDRFRPTINPSQYNGHPRLLAERRRIVQAALKVSRGTRSSYERRAAELLNCGVGAVVAYL